MVEKLRNPEYPASMSEGGWFIPTDYILMKPWFRTGLLRLYVSGLGADSSVLDLNAGTHGLGPDIVQAGHEYATLEQNVRVRDVLQAQGLSTQDWRPPYIPGPDASCDLVISLALFEHLPTWVAAFELLLEIKRVLVAGGRVVIVAPNAPGNGSMFWDDYKHGWYVSRKRLMDMATDAGMEVVSTRYTVGWITLMQGPLGALGRLCARALIGTLNVTPVARFLETSGLDGFAAKVRKTIFELVAVELRKPHG